MSDDRIGQLEERVASLEAIVRVLVTSAEERARVAAATDALDGNDAEMPETIDREAAVLFVGSTLRTMLAAVHPTKRAEALADSTPAEALAVAAPMLADAHRPQITALERYARAHSLTWADLGVSA